jgi:hypothetical protein
MVKLPMKTLVLQVFPISEQQETMQIVLTHQSLDEELITFVLFQKHKNFQ